MLMSKYLFRPIHSRGSFFALISIFRQNSFGVFFSLFNFSLFKLFFFLHTMSDERSELQSQLVLRADQSAKALQQSNLVAHESISSLRESNRVAETIIKNLTHRCDQLEQKVESFTSGNHRNNPTQFRKAVQILEDVDANGVNTDCGEAFSRAVIDCLQAGRACNGTASKYIPSKREEELLDEKKLRVIKNLQASEKRSQKRKAEESKTSKSSKK
jgi:hypothetical protein